MHRFDATVQNSLADAARAFEKHQLILRDDSYGRWVIGRVGSSTYLTEVISLYGGRLFVGGDINDAVFAYFSGPERGAQWHRAKLYWIGGSDLSYVAHKMQIGLGLGATEWSSEAAVRELNALRDEDKEAEESTIGGFNRAIACAERGDKDGMLEVLYETADLEYGGSIGHVVSARVIYAWTAVQRLIKLLEVADAI